MGEARRSSVKGLSTARQDLNLIPRKAPSRLTNRLVRTRMLGGVRGRGLAAPSYSISERTAAERGDGPDEGSRIRQAGEGGESGIAISGPPAL